MNNRVKDQLNRPLKDLRISLTDRCQFRCNYCLPAEHIDVMRQQSQQHELLTFTEIVQVAKSFAAMGVNKIRLTGGEPLLRKNLADLVRKLKDIDGIKEVAMTTNGALLPPVLDELVEAGLDRITISLDAIDDKLFKYITGTNQDVDEIINVIMRCAETELKAVKVNCVVQKGINEHQILPLLNTFIHLPVEVRFIEYMDVGNINGWEANQVFTTEATLKSVQNAYDISLIAEEPASHVARRYRLIDRKTKSELTVFGTISSISKPFCHYCNRARISAKGEIFTCLFSQQGHDIRQLISSPALLDEKIHDLWQQRNDQYSMQRNLRIPKPADKIEMFIIGG